MINTAGTEQELHDVPWSEHPHQDNDDSEEDEGAEKPDRFLQLRPSPELGWRVYA
jgi:hypothetical protein